MDASRGPRDFPEVSHLSEGASTCVNLYWIPVGAGGAWFVRLNGRVYGRIKGLRGGRRPLDLYHSALEVDLSEDRFVIEVAPIPDAHPESRGVVVEGPVGSRWISGFRTFRYEVRRWRNGVIPDVGEAVASPQRLTADPHRARQLLDLVGRVPPLVWGRDQLGVGDMWNSNSVISWLLACTGLPIDGIQPPRGGWVPGWKAGIIMAQRHLANQGLAESPKQSRSSKPRPPALDHRLRRRPPPDQSSTISHSVDQCD